MVGCGLKVPLNLRKIPASPRKKKEKWCTTTTPPPHKHTHTRLHVFHWSDAFELSAFFAHYWYIDEMNVIQLNEYVFYFVTGLCHKEITRDMRAHLVIQLLVNLQSVWNYVDHFHCFSKKFSLESYVKPTINTGAVSCYTLLLNLDPSDPSRIQNSG